MTEVERLIEAVKAYLCLYNSTFPEFKIKLRTECLDCCCMLLYIYSRLQQHATQCNNIKQFIHSRSDSVSQLSFNVDVNITLQQLYPVLKTTENSDTLDF